MNWYESPFGHVKYALATSNKQMRKEGFNTSPSDAPACTIFFETNELIVFVDKKQAKYRKQAEVIALIVHEAVHVWQEIKQRMGEQNPSIEFEAYSIQQIVVNLVSDYYG